MLVNVEEFWTLIEYSARDGRAGAPPARIRWLEEKLALLRGRAIVDFEIHLDHTRRRADTYDLWGAAVRITGSGSQDGFFYFQPWLIGLGRDVFDRVVAHPDALADVPLVRELATLPRPWPYAAYPWWEDLNYAALHAYQRLHGEAVDVRDVIESRGHRLRSDPGPSGTRWRLDDDAEARARLPRLSGLFPPRSTPAAGRSR